MSDHGSEDERPPPPASNSPSHPIQRRHFRTLEQNQQEILNFLRNFQPAQPTQAAPTPHLLSSIAGIDFHLRSPADIASGPTESFSVNIHPHEPGPEAFHAALTGYWADRFRRVSGEFGDRWLNAIHDGYRRVQQERGGPPQVSGSGGDGGGGSGGDDNGGDSNGGGDPTGELAGGEDGSLAGRSGQYSTLR